MRVCGTCGTENPAHRDFCVRCGTYLRWELTANAQLVAGPHETVERERGPNPEPVRRSSTQAYPVARTPTRGAPGADSVVVKVGTPDGNGGPPLAQVEAGGQAVLVARVRNQSGIVDNYDLLVTGIPEGWWTIAPATVYLVPFGAPGNGVSEQEVEVQLHPPRTPDAEARPWQIEIVARSRAHGVDVATAEATLVIAPYHELESELRPARAAGRRRARYALQVRNRANAPVEVEVSGLDGEDACRFRFEQARFLAEPGRRSGTVFWVYPRKQTLVGRPVERRFQVLARAAGGESDAPARQGVLKHKPWLPWWILLAAPLALVAAVGMLALRTQTVVVPDLSTAQTEIDVSKLLRQNGLVLGERQEQAVEKWTRLVLDQTPAHGERVKKGTQVTIVIAVSHEQVSVPSVVGRTLQDAAQALQQAGLQLGPAGTPPLDPATSLIAVQNPPAETVVDKGTQVTPYFEGPPKDDPEPGATTPTTTEGGTTTGPAPKKHDKGGRPHLAKLTLPAVTGLTLAGAVAAVQAQGLTVDLVQRFSADVPPNGLIAQEPAAGADVSKDTVVKLFVSAGYPQIAFDAGGDLRRMSGGNGHALAPLARDRADLEEQAAWSPSGAYVAYRRGTADEGRIWLVDPARPTSARPLTDPGFDDRRPAFSPDGTVVAFVRGHRGGDYDLCFQAVDAPAAPQCVADPQTSVTRPAWSPGGRAILVVGAIAGQPQQTELHEYYTNTASSPEAADWRSLGAVTTTMHQPQAAAYVAGAAWSPDGKRVAFTANWGSDPSAFGLFLAPVDDDVLGKPKAVEGVTGCEVAWRLDGLELALTQHPGCGDGGGSVVRLDPGHPDEQVVLRKSGAANATWQPLVLVN